MKWSRPEDRAFLATLPPDAPALQVPEVWPEVAWYLDAFNELSASRPMAMGSIGYIPVTEIVAWAAAYGVEDVPTLVRHVRALDGVYVAEWIERQKRDADRTKAQREGDRPAGGS